MLSVPPPKLSPLFTYYGFCFVLFFYLLSSLSWNFYLLQAHWIHFHPPLCQKGHTIDLQYNVCLAKSALLSSYLVKNQWKFIFYIEFYIVGYCLINQNHKNNQQKLVTRFKCADFIDTIYLNFPNFLKLICIEFIYASKIKIRNVNILLASKLS